MIGFITYRSRLVVGVSNGMGLFFHEYQIERSGVSNVTVHYGISAQIKWLRVKILVTIVVNNTRRMNNNGDMCACKYCKYTNIH